LAAAQENGGRSEESARRSGPAMFEARWTEALKPFHLLRRMI